MGSAVSDTGPGYARAPCEAHPYDGALHPGELLAWRLEVDRRVRPGRMYRVRATNQNGWLFGGRPVRLREIRPAVYCYRLNFDVAGERGDPGDQRARCLYTDSWYPAAIALSPVEASGEERDRRTASGC